MNRRRFLGATAAGTRYWRVIRQPVGPVHFAGEHTDTDTASMEGAVRSGRRVAAEIDSQPGTENPRAATP